MNSKYSSYILLITLGVLMVIGTFLKLLGVWDISSDWFWFLAGAGVVIETIIALQKQKKFDNKYKIIEKNFSVEKKD